MGSQSRSSLITDSPIYEGLKLQYRPSYSCSNIESKQVCRFDLLKHYLRDKGLLKTVSMMKTIVNTLVIFLFSFCMRVFTELMVRNTPAME